MVRAAVPQDGTPDGLKPLFFFTTSALWGARCGQSARRVLTGGTSTRGHAGSVRSPARKRRLRQGSAKATASRLVSTDHSIPFAPLREFLSKRVTDGVVRRLIDKWLKAGVMERGQVFYPETGTPQGGVVSPLLSNVFLHYVVDVWFAHEVQPRLRAPSSLVRYCDDFVMLFACREDAERVQAVLGKRLGRFGLQLHPDKTRLLDFRPRKSPCHVAGPTPDASFVFLGFLHLWGKSRKGNWVVRQYTAKGRLARALRAINETCRRMRHESLPDQHRRLSRMLNGHYAYFGISSNSKQLGRFYHQVKRLWRKWLSRRSRMSQLSWAKFAEKILQAFPLPSPKIVHRYVVT